MTASTDIFRDVELDESLEAMQSAVAENLERVEAITTWAIMWPAATDPETLRVSFSPKNHGKTLAMADLKDLEANAKLAIRYLAILDQALCMITVRLGSDQAGKVLRVLEHALAHLRWIVQWGKDHQAADVARAAQLALDGLAVVGVHLELHQSGS